MKDRALTFERTHIGATSLQYSIKAKECGEHYGTVEHSLLHCPPDNNYKEPSQQRIQVEGASERRNKM